MVGQERDKRSSAYCRGFEACLHFDGRLRETGRASSATGYTSSAARGGVKPVFSFGEEEGGESLKEHFKS